MVTIINRFSIAIVACSVFTEAAFSMCGAVPHRISDPEIVKTELVISSSAWHQKSLDIDPTLKGPSVKSRAPAMSDNGTFAALESGGDAKVYSFATKGWSKITGAGDVVGVGGRHLVSIDKQSGACRVQNFKSEVLIEIPAAANLRQMGRPIVVEYMESRNLLFVADGENIRVFSLEEEPRQIGIVDVKSAGDEMRFPTNLAAEIVSIGYLEKRSLLFVTVGDDQKVIPLLFSVSGGGEGFEFVAPIQNVELAPAEYAISREEFDELKSYYPEAADVQYSEYSRALQQQIQPRLAKTIVLPDVTLTRIYRYGAGDGYTNHVFFHNVPGFWEMKNVRFLQEDVSTMAFSPKNVFLAFGSEDGTIYVTQPQRGVKPIHINSDTHEGPIRRLTWVDDYTLYATSDNGQVSITRIEY